MSLSEFWSKASEPNIWHSKNSSILETIHNSKPHPLFAFFFPFCICLTLSLTVNDINYYFWGFFIESHKSVLSSWHAPHDSNYIKVIKQNSVPCCQTHVSILLLIKSKPKGKSKMDQNLPFLFKNFIIEHTNDNLLNRNDDVEMHNKI